MALFTLHPEWHTCHVTNRNTQHKYTADQVQFNIYRIARKIWDLDSKSPKRLRGKNKEPLRASRHKFASSLWFLHHCEKLLVADGSRYTLSDTGTQVVSWLKQRLPFKEGPRLSDVRNPDLVRELGKLITKLTGYKGGRRIKKK